MDTSLDHNQPSDHPPNVANEAQHALPAKPQVVQEPLPATGTTRKIEETAETIGQTAHKPARIPHLQQDLLALVGLRPLVDTVARTDPTTGEKINKMRKSYEGKAKGFGLAGRNRAVKHDHEKSMGLLQMAQWPAEEWHSQKVHARDVRNGLSEATMKKLDMAMQMQPGPVPNTAEHNWEDLLGNERVKPIAPIDDRPKKLNRLETGVSASGQVNTMRPATDKMPITEANRPKRTGRKRRYDDHSFEGYGEGFLDDEGDVLVDLGGDTSDEGSRRGGASKKRRKVDQAIPCRRLLHTIADLFDQEYTSTNTPTIGDRRGSYGIGMLGVGSGIGAYGR
ncbi:MAG: hypothetical protein Q9210_004549 [Variospora velana]